MRPELSPDRFLNPRLNLAMNTLEKLLDRRHSLYPYPDLYAQEINHLTKLIEALIDRAFPASQHQSNNQ